MSLGLRAVLGSWLARCRGRRFMIFWRFGVQGEEFEVEFFVQDFAFLLAGGGQQVVGQVHEQRRLPARVRKGLEQLGAHEFGVAGPP